jgi:hypothetical protein
MPGLMLLNAHIEPVILGTVGRQRHLLCGRALINWDRVESYDALATGTWSGAQLLV